MLIFDTFWLSRQRAARRLERGSSERRRHCSNSASDWLTVFTGWKRQTKRDRRSLWRQNNIYFIAVKINRV